mgnify:CR=1 FL=1
MVKKELIEEISNIANAKTNITKKDIGIVLDSLKQVTIETVKEGKEVKISNFGKFYGKKYKAREIENYLGRGETVQIPAGVTPKFKAYKNFKESIQEK